VQPSLNAFGFLFVLYVVLTYVVDIASSLRLLHGFIISGSLGMLLTAVAVLIIADCRNSHDWIGL